MKTLLAQHRLLSVLAVTCSLLVADVSRGQFSFSEISSGSFKKKGGSSTSSVPHLNWGGKGTSSLAPSVRPSVSSRPSVSLGSIFGSGKGGSQTLNPQTGPTRIPGSSSSEIGKRPNRNPSYPNWTPSRPSTRPGTIKVPGTGTVNVLPGTTVRPKYPNLRPDVSTIRPKFPNLTPKYPDFTPSNPGRNPKYPLPSNPTPKNPIPNNPTPKNPGTSVLPSNPGGTVIRPNPKRPIATPGKNPLPGNIVKPLPGTLVTPLPNFVPKPAKPTLPIIDIAKLPKNPVLPPAASPIKDDITNPDDGPADPGEDGPHEDSPNEDGPNDGDDDEGDDDGPQNDDPNDDDHDPNDPHDDQPDDQPGEQPGDPDHDHPHDDHPHHDHPHHDHPGTIHDHCFDIIIGWGDCCVCTPCIPCHDNHCVIPNNCIPAGTVLLINPEETGHAVQFVLAGRSYVLQPGESQEYTIGASAIIQFDRGGAFGIARYTLSNRIYSFKLTDQGWDLARKVFKATIDNSDNANDFHYMIGEEPQVVLAGTQNVHKSDFPMVATFDAGNGQVMQKAIGTAVYKVAINLETNLWDLMPEGQASAGALAAAEPPAE